MAEIDRIRALAGLLVLDDDDDDLFLSSPSAGRHVDGCSDNSVATTKATKAVAKASSGNQIRHGVVRNQQQDEILQEMQQKGLICEKSANSNIAHDGSSDDPGKTASTNTTHYSLSIAIDERCDKESTDDISESEHHTDRLVFGKPQTFGAAGGYETNYMPNVQQRAVAISAWKILEMKKEKKNGHARAREWKVGEEHEEVYEREQHKDVENEIGNGATTTGDENYSSEHGKKSKIPSFLSHFENAKPTHGDEENSINGIACPPMTPRSGGGTRVPLSPRVTALSARNVGVSPRHVLSPRNVLSPREALQKMEASRNPSSRYTKRESSVFSHRNEVLSPRSKALLSPSRKIEKNKNNDPPETNLVLVEKISANQRKANNMPSDEVDKMIHDTLEEASRLLQSAEQASDVSKEVTLNNDCHGTIDVKFDEQLLSAAELARALDKFLVEDDSLEDEASTDDDDETESMKNKCACVESKSEATKDDVELNNVSNLTEKKGGLPESSKQKFLEQQQTSEWGELTASHLDDTKERDLAFPTDFENLTGDEVASNYATSTYDSFFPVDFDDENIPKIIPLSCKATSNSTVQRKRKLPKIKISIEGAPTFKVDGNGMNKASPMFFFSQPSPSCGDNAGLLQSRHYFDKPRALFDGKGKIETSKKILLPLTNPTKILNIKEFINHSFPLKHERDKDGLSPSTAGLLEMNHNAGSMEMDENVCLVSVRELANLTPKTHECEHFFVGPISSPTANKTGTLQKAPSSPMLYGSVVRPALCVSPVQKKLTPGRDKKKKNTNTKILQRIKSPLLSGKKLGSVGLNDDLAFGRL